MSLNNPAAYVLVNQEDSDYSISSENSEPHLICQPKIHKQSNHNSSKSGKSIPKSNTKVSIQLNKIHKQTRRVSRVSESSIHELGPSFESIERKETVKCVFSSTLFVILIVAFIYVTIIKNPEM